MSDIEKLFRILVELFNEVCLPVLFLSIVIASIMLIVEWRKSKKKGRENE